MKDEHKALSREELEKLQRIVNDGWQIGNDRGARLLATMKGKNADIELLLDLVIQMQKIVFEIPMLPDTSYGELKRLFGAALAGEPEEKGKL